MHRWVRRVGAALDMIPPVYSYCKKRARPTSPIRFSASFLHLVSAEANRSQVRRQVCERSGPGNPGQ
eukprot:9095787-Pyramimonas_sp.AAC.1